MHFLSRPRRARRSGEWTSERAVTFIVTLGTSRCVTLAARAAGMSRKSAYALKNRDPAFAAAWRAALQVGEAARVKAQLCPARQGNSQSGASPSTLSTSMPRRSLEAASAEREEFFARLRESAALAPRVPAQ